MAIDTVRQMSSMQTGRHADAQTRRHQKPGQTPDTRRQTPDTRHHRPSAYGQPLEPPRPGPRPQARPSGQGPEIRPGPAGRWHAGRQQEQEQEEAASRQPAVISSAPGLCLAAVQAPPNLSLRMLRIRYGCYGGLDLPAGAGSLGAAARPC